MWWTPPKLGRRFGVSSAKILNLIRAGHLKAHNLATAPGASPRWRISEEDVRAFLAARASTPPEPKPTRRRRRKESQEIPEYVR
jgi:hypothetical protein